MVAQVGSLPNLLMSLVLTLTAYGPQPVANAEQMPKVVPRFELADLDGNRIALEDHRGKVVMINFWATWCPPCVAELPSMDALKKSLADKPFEILAINMAEDRETIRAFLERTGLAFDFPLLLDPDGVVADQYAVSGLPATLLVDKQGQFAFGGVGAREWDGAEAVAEILPLFD